MTENSKFQTIGFWSYLRIGYCNLEFICHLVLVICYFRFIRVRNIVFKINSLRHSLKLPRSNILTTHAPNKNFHPFKTKFQQLGIIRFQLLEKRRFYLVAF